MFKTALFRLNEEFPALLTGCRLHLQLGCTASFRYSSRLGYLESPPSRETTFPCHFRHLSHTALSPTVTTFAYLDISDASLAISSFICWEDSFLPASTLSRRLLLCFSLPSEASYAFLSRASSS